MNTNKEILFLEPYFADLIWGGSKLREKFNFDIPSDTTGEAWLISAYPNQSSIVKNGIYKNYNLKDLWNKHRELFGNCKLAEFPLLIKFIDAKADLSVQVHPDDAYANVHENGELGKKECWYVLDCEPDTKIIIGQKTRSKKDFNNLLNENKWDQILNEIPIKPGDFFQIDPGTIHAIKGGTMILETQQTSDLTYRVYDYNRLQNGKPRELHIDKALDVINFDQKVSAAKNYFNDKNTKTNLITCDKYCVDLLNINGNYTSTQDYNFLNFTVTEGQGVIDDQKIKAGDSWILPSEYEDFTIKGELKIITSHI